MHVEDLEDDVTSDRRADALVTRRAWIAAGSGLALAASRLLLPEWLVEETDAAELPVRHVQHRAAKRRQRRDHRLEQKGRQRRRGAKPHERKPRVLFKGISLTVVNNLTEADLDFNYFFGTVGWKFDRRFSLSPNATMTLNTEFLHAGVELVGLKLPFVWAENPPGGKENVSVQYGGSMRESGYDGGTTAIDHTNLSVGQETHVVVPLDGGGRFPNIALTIRRESDTNEFKVFTITVASAR